VVNMLTCLTCHVHQSCSALQSLSVIDAPRLKDKALLTALPRLADSLTKLDLSGCCHVTRGVGEAVGKLTKLEHLALTGGVSDWA